MGRAVSIFREGRASISYSRWIKSPPTPRGWIGILECIFSSETIAELATTGEAFEVIQPNSSCQSEMMAMTKKEAYKVLVNLAIRPSYSYVILLFQSYND